jgi:RNA recognition motif-containing protein
MNIYVGNLNYKVNEEAIKEAFEAYAPVSSVKIVMDKETGRSKGFGFVEMDDDASAERAIEELNQSELMGRKMVVSQARPKKEFKKNY